MSRPAARRVCALFAVLLSVLASAANAHKPSDSYLTLRVDGTQIEGQWDIALRDLDLALSLDSNQDGAITWGEVRSRHAEIAAFALSRLSFAADHDACPISATGHLIDHHSDGAYAVLRFRSTCPHAPAALNVDYRLLFDLDPRHRGLMQFEHAGQVRTAIFAPETHAQDLVLAEADRLQQFAQYVWHGVWHIWLGFDHVLFLLSLLLPAVLVRNGVGWKSAPELKAALWDVLRVVTAFTLAHSLTLTLAALNVIALPSRLVESAIAVSVVLAALNNIFPVVNARRWLLAFAFGLIHGFGFASVLADLGLPHGALLASLVAFNLGVEIGQLAIVALLLPLAWWLRGSWVYRRLTLYGGSAVVAVLALAWLAERAFDLRLVSWSAS